MGEHRRHEEGSHFGVHLTLDGYYGCPVRLGDMDHIARFLRDLPPRLGMSRLLEPTLVEVGELNRKDPGGITGFVLIAESHISIHTFPLRKFVSADVYTCQDSLNKVWIKDLFVDAFALQDVEMNYLIRGTRYPRTNLTLPSDAVGRQSLLVAED